MSEKIDAIGTVLVNLPCIIWCALSYQLFILKYQTLNPDVLSIGFRCYCFGAIGVIIWAYTHKTSNFICKKVGKKKSKN